MVNLIVANWTNRTKVPMPENEQFNLTRELEDLSKKQEPGAIPKIQRTRAKLILDYLNRGQIVKGRKELLTYTNWLENGRDLPLADRIEMHSQLAIIHMSLEELDPAVKQYDIIINELGQPTKPDIMLLKARMLNDRGVAYYLFAQSLEKPDAVKVYLTASSNDFKECKELLDQLSIIVPGRDRQREDLLVTVAANQKFFSDDMIFTPSKERP